MIWGIGQFRGAEPYRGDHSRATRSSRNQALTNRIFAWAISPEQHSQRFSPDFVRLDVILRSRVARLFQVRMREEVLDNLLS